MDLSVLHSLMEGALVVCENVLPRRYVLPLEGVQTQHSSAGSIREKTFNFVYPQKGSLVCLQDTKSISSSELRGKVGTSTFDSLQGEI